ncbi:MAG: L,D-transpeptidase [Bacteroidetes bacterium]|nr:L,D-transpeptidase [Bacteroidota bacterium]
MNRFIGTTDEISAPAERQPIIKKSWLLIFSGVFIMIILCTLTLLFSIPIREVMLTFFKDPNFPSHRQAISASEIESLIGQKIKNIATLQKKVDKLTPKNPYLIINTSENEFVLKEADSIIRKGICSTGSYVLLDAGADQKYMFKTPRGQFKIQGKTESPVWRKPDWAFIEEGLPILAPDAPERYETGVLGDYALYLGHGYMLHGTIYKRFLGMPVTHGCVRFGDEDLEIIYKNLQVNSKVFIY